MTEARKSWHAEWPARLEREKFEMRRRYPTMELRKLKGDQLAWIGPVKTRRGQTYNIGIAYPDDFPMSSPRVYPVDDDFEGNFVQTPHRLVDGSLCLAYPCFDNPSATAADIVGAAAAWLDAFERFVESGRWGGSEPISTPVHSPRTRRRQRVFISYSHADAEWLARLRVHFKPLEAAGIVDVWDDTRIQAGDVWEDEIKQALADAAVAVLLISADFLASDFIRETEVPALLAAAETEGANILPVIVSPCRFIRDKALSRFQAVNPPSLPLSAMDQNEQEKALVRLANAVEFVVNLAHKSAAEEQSVLLVREPKTHNNAMPSGGDSAALHPRP